MTTLRPGPGIAGLTLATLVVACGGTDARDPYRAAAPTMAVGGGGAGAEGGAQPCIPTDEPLIWEWAVAAGSDTRDVVGDLAVTEDAVIVTGYFKGDSMSFGSHQLLKSGDESLFVVKYDGAGDVVWAKTAASDVYAWGSGLALGHSGRTYVVGSFRESLTMDGTTLVSNGFTDAFLLVLDESGNLIDAVSFGGTNHNDHGYGVAAAPDGRIYICGSFWSNTVDFGGTTLTNTGYSDVFVACLDQSLGVLWARSATGGHSDTAGRISLGAGATIHLFGEHMSAPLAFDGIELDNVGSTDLFWTTHEATGNVVWARAAGGNSMELAGDLAIDTSGSVYLTGTYSSNEIAFGETVLSLHNPGAFSNDTFIAKYDAQGSLGWAIDSWQSTSEALGHSLAISAADEIYAVGSFVGDISFGAQTLVGSGGHDVYFLKLASDGTAMWTVGAGGDEDDAARRVAVDPTGAIYVAGEYRSQQLSLGGTTLSNQGDSTDIFVTKMREDPCYR